MPLAWPAKRSSHRRHTPRPPSLKFITMCGMGYLQEQEVPHRAGWRVIEVQARSTEGLDLTRRPLEELQRLLPPGEAAFPAQMAAGRRAGQPRTACRWSVDPPGPCATPAERWFCLLTSLQTSALPVLQGRLRGRGQSKARPGRPGLVPGRLAAWRPRGAAPPRAGPALAQRRGVPQAAAAAPVVAVAAAAPASPLGPRPGRNDAAAAPQAPVAQTDGDSGQHKEHPSTKGRRGPVRRLSLVLRATAGGRRPEQPMADATPSPWPAGRGWVPARGGLAGRRPQGASRMPPPHPREPARALEQPRAKQALPPRRRRREPVNRSVQRRRVGTARSRRGKDGGRALVLARCWALHNIRGRRPPGQLML
jgi:hypothetical protein